MPHLPKGMSSELASSSILGQHVQEKHVDCGLPQKLGPLRFSE